MFQSAEAVGWVELRETHHESRELVGLVKLDPPYLLKKLLGPAQQASALAIAP